ncbi:MAG: arylmalonate decarboxylase [Parvibaculaceae bacterium]
MTSAPVTIRSKPDDAVLDAGRHWRAKLGFVVLAMEQTVEADVFRMTPDNVGVHFTRMPMSNDVTFEALAGMAPGIAAAGSLLLPEDRLDVLCYTCNSGTMVIGESAVMAALDDGKRVGKTTTVMTGVVRALAAVGARTISVATPYPDAVNSIVHGFLSSYGFKIAEFQGLNLKRNTDIDRVTPGFLRGYARSVDRPEAEAVFVCCGALRALDIVADLEAELGKPVIVSNQGMMWDCLRLAGISDCLPGTGRLFSLGIDDHKAAVARLAERRPS